MWRVSLVILFVLLVSCTPPIPTVGFFSTPEEAVQFVADTIIPTSEPPGEDHWQHPEETLALGTGDCEDLALLALWVSPPTSRRYLVIGYGRGWGHAWVSIDGEHYEPQLGLNMGLDYYQRSFDFIFIRYIPFRRAMEWVE